MKNNLCFITVIVLYTNALYVSAEDKVIGRMDCTVKAHDILLTDDGVVENHLYGGYYGKAAVGDDVIVHYQLSEGSEFNVWLFEDSDKENQKYASFRVNATDDKETKLYSSATRIEVLHDDPSNFVEISENSINLSRSDRWLERTSRLSLTRYFKNDWSGIGYSMTNTAVITYGIDCRHTRDSLDAVLKRLRNR